MTHNNHAFVDFVEDFETLTPEIVQGFQAMYPSHHLLNEFCDFYVENEEQFDNELEAFFFFIQNIFTP